MGYRLNKTEEDEIRDFMIENSISETIGPGYETATGDGGFLDEFNSLKQKIDFAHREYKIQLEDLETRKLRLHEETKKKVISVILLVASPLFCIVLLYIFTILSNLSGLFSVLYVFFLIFTPAVIFVCEFGLLPIMLRNMLNLLWQSSVLNSDERYAEYRKKNYVISFADEKHFLEDRIREYNELTQDIQKRGLDKKDGQLQNCDIDTMTEEQRAVLDKMRGMSDLKDFRTSVLATRKEGGIVWAVVGMTAAVAIALFVLV